MITIQPFSKFQCLQPLCWSLYAVSCLLYLCIFVCLCECVCLRSTMSSSICCLCVCLCLSLSTVCLCLLSLSGFLSVSLLSLCLLGVCLSLLFLSLGPSRCLSLCLSFSYLWIPLSVSVCCLPLCPAWVWARFIQSVP